MDEARYREAERSYWDVCSARPTDRWLDLARPSTRVRVLEVGEGPPLVFVHGGPGAGAIFAPLAALLPDFRCILIDRPGCGLSPAVAFEGRQPPELMTEILASCLDALEIDRARIVGSSFGSSCALWLARRAPERVDRICHQGVPAFLAESRLPLMVKVLATPGLGYAAARLPMNPTAVRGFLRSLGEQYLLDSGGPAGFTDWWIALARHTDTMPNERDAIRSAISWSGAPRIERFADAEIQALPHPMSFYWGSNEPFAEVAYAERLVAGMRRAAIEVVPNAGHIPWLLDAKRSAEHVRAFLQAT